MADDEKVMALLLWLKDEGARITHEHRLGTVTDQAVDIVREAQQEEVSRRHADVTLTPAILAFIEDLFEMQKTYVESEKELARASGMVAALTSVAGKIEELGL